MATSTVTCVVIVAESVVEQRLLADLSTCGARGWTVTAAQGQGPRNRRVSEIEGGNIRVEVLVSENVATRIWTCLEEMYFPNYAVAAWAFPVSVARPARYISSEQS